MSEKDGHCIQNMRLLCEFPSTKLDALAEDNEDRRQAHGFCCPTSSRVSLVGFSAGVQRICCKHREATIQDGSFTSGNASM